MSELKPCPFCASPAEMEPWHGGGPNKQLISCTSDTCDARPAVTGETPAEAIAAWNRRESLAADEPKLAKREAGEAVECSKCEGTGQLQTELRGFEHCTTCDGSGALTHPAPTHENGSGEKAETVDKLFANCDAWGAKEWFARLAMAVSRRDEAVRSGDDIAFETYNNIASSSATRLAREFATEINAALSHTSGEVTEAGIPKSISDAELSQWAEKRADDAGRLARELVAYRRGSLPQDVINLVIAARIVAFEDQSPEALRSLDEASEAFASRVPWDNAPEGEQ